MQPNRQTARVSHHDPRRGAMALEAKLGMFVITILVFAFGFIVYRKFDRQHQLASIPPQSQPEVEDGNAAPLTDAAGGALQEADNSATAYAESDDAQLFSGYAAATAEPQTGLSGEQSAMLNEPLDEPLNEPATATFAANTSSDDSGFPDWTATNPDEPSAAATTASPSDGVPVWAGMDEPATIAPPAAPDTMQPDELPSFDAVASRTDSSLAHIDQTETGTQPAVMSPAASATDESEPQFAFDAAALSSDSEPVELSPESFAAAADEPAAFPDFGSPVDEPQLQFDAPSDAGTGGLLADAAGTDPAQTSESSTSLPVFPEQMATPRSEQEVAATDGSLTDPPFITDAESFTSPLPMDSGDEPEFSGSAARANGDSAPPPDLMADSAVAVNLPTTLSPVEEPGQPDPAAADPLLSFSERTPGQPQDVAEPELPPVTIPDPSPQPSPAPERAPMLLAMNSPVQSGTADETLTDWPAFDDSKPPSTTSPGGETASPSQSAPQTPADPFGGKSFSARDLDDLQLQPQAAPVTDPGSTQTPAWPESGNSSTRSTAPAAAPGTKFSVTAYQYQHDAPTSDSTVEKWNVTEVRPGENYWTISRRVYGTSRYFSALALFNQNRIPDPRKMRQGMKILIPSEEKLESLYPQLFENQRPKRVLPAAFLTLEDGSPAYRVGAAETLSEISERFLGRSSRWIEIYRMNQNILKDPNKLKPGTILALPDDAVQVHVIP